MRIIDVDILISLLSMSILIELQYEDQFSIFNTF
jgi:hypothetical protein